MIKYLVIACLVMFSLPANATQQSKTITADGTYCIGRASNPPAWSKYLATVAVDGTFGSGTISWVITYDGGTTSQAMMDLTGVAATSSADDQFNVELGNFSRTQPQICAVMAGATNPSVVFRVTDNN